MIKSLIVYFQFFTRIPIPLAVDEPTERIRSGIKVFTLFGLLLGCLEALVFWGLQYLFGPMLAWVMTLFFDVLLTGGFHLDALSDMADGLFSSRKKERMLEIMKDSRVGSNGVLALIFYYGFLFFAFQSLVSVTELATRFLIVLLFQMVGKNGITLLMVKMNYAGATEQGLGYSFTKVKTSDILIAQIFTLVALILTFRTAGILIYFITVCSILLYRSFVISKVEGFNGDTLGAASPLSQVVFLLALYGLRGLL